MSTILLISGDNSVRLEFMENERNDESTQIKLSGCYSNSHNHNIH